MKKLFSLFFIFILAAATCFAQNENLSQYERNVLNFNVNGIKLGDSFEKFKSVFTDAVYNSNSSNEFTKAYSVFSVKNVTVVVFYFFEDRLCVITNVYKKPELQKLGGRDTVLDTFFSKYGQSDEAGDIYNPYLRWNFKSVARSVLIPGIDDSELFISFLDTDLMKKYEQKKNDSMYYGF